MIPPIHGVERVKNITLLGVIYQEKFSFFEHLNKTLTIANQRLYLVNSLRKSGLCPESTNVIFHSLIMSKLTYCVPSWHTFISVDDKNKLNKFLKKAYKWGCIDTCFIWDNITNEIDDKFYTHMTRYPQHCIAYLIPPQKPSGYNLRSQNNIIIPQITMEIHKKSFINHMIFKDIY